MSGKSISNIRWKFNGNVFFKLSFLKLLGNINETLSQNSQDFFINLIANDDWRPNGGLPIMCILL